MKFISSLLVLFVTVFLVAECLPSSPREEPEIVIVPLESQVDELARLHGHGDLPVNPFEEDEDDETLARVGFPYGFYFPQFLSGIDGFVRNMFENLKGFSVNPTNWGNVTNATSTQKVIDGYLVTVNETTYQQNDNSSVFQVKVIDVKPLPTTEGPTSGTKTESSEIDSKENTSVTSEESLDDKRESNNEIPKEKKPDAETFDNDHSETAELLDTREFHSSDRYNEVDNNSIDGVDMEPISLLGDTYVNTLQDKMKGGMIMVPHDVEVFDVDDGKSIYSYEPYPPHTFRERTQKIVT